MSDAFPPSSNPSGLIGVKSEFEAEGLTQLEVADFFVRNPWAKLRVIKIGGCEAKTDFRAALRLGANVVVAPMIESPFALIKFGAMYQDSTKVRRWINIETVEGVSKAKAICQSALSHGVTGIVIGRGDLAESMGLDRAEADSGQVQKLVIEIATIAKEHNLYVGVGGMVSQSSIANLTELNQRGLIDHFETRKILISADVTDISNNIRNALNAELEWITASLQNLASMETDLRKRASRLVAEVKN